MLKENVVKTNLTDTAPNYTTYRMGIGILLYRYAITELQHYRYSATAIFYVYRLSSKSVSTIASSFYGQTLSGEFSHFTTAVKLHF